MREKTSGIGNSGLLEEETSFYGGYPWSLNPFLSVQEGIDHLLEELRRLDSYSPGWQRDEVITNVCLLGEMIAVAADDYIAGTWYNFSKLAGVLPIVRPLLPMAAKLQDIGVRMRAFRLRRLHNWRQDWQAALVKCLISLPGLDSSDQISGRSVSKLASLLPPPFPEELLRKRPRVPGAFRSKDYSHYDAIRLGEKFEHEFSDRKRPLLVVGLRTAGSYFATVLCAFLKYRGYENIRWVTLRAKKGIAHWEGKALGTRKTRRRTGVGNRRTPEWRRNPRQNCGPVSFQGVRFRRRCLPVSGASRSTKLAKSSDVARSFIHSSASSEAGGVA